MPLGGVGARFARFLMTMIVDTHGHTEGVTGPRCTKTSRGSTSAAPGIDRSPCASAAASQRPPTSRADSGTRPTVRSPRPLQGFAGRLRSSYLKQGVRRRPHVGAHRLPQGGGGSQTFRRAARRHSTRQRMVKRGLVSTCWHRRASTSEMRPSFRRSISSWASKRARRLRLG